MNNTIKLLLIIITTQILFGCSATRYISSIFKQKYIIYASKGGKAYYYYGDIFIIMQIYSIEIYFSTTLLTR